LPFAGELVGFGGVFAQESGVFGFDAEHAGRDCKFELKIGRAVRHGAAIPIELNVARSEEDGEWIVGESTSKRDSIRCDGSNATAAAIEKTSGARLRWVDYVGLERGPLDREHFMIERLGLFVVVRFGGEESEAFGVHENAQPIGFELQGVRGVFCVLRSFVGFQPRVLGLRLLESRNARRTCNPVCAARKFSVGGRDRCGFGRRLVESMDYRRVRSAARAAIEVSGDRWNANSALR
jgi:hypothetical protein